MLGAVLAFLNIGSSEMILIVFVALLLFGGEKLPGIARTLGKGIRDFKDASDGVKREINNQINSFEEKKEAEKITPHTEVTEDTHSEAETRPLIDTTPVAGTAALGQTTVTDEHHHEGDVHTGNTINLEKKPVDTHDEHTAPVEHEKTIHE